MFQNDDESLENKKRLKTVDDEKLKNTNNFDQTLKTQKLAKMFDCHYSIIADDKLINLVNGCHMNLLDLNKTIRINMTGIFSASNQK